MRAPFSHWFIAFGGGWLWLACGPGVAGAETNFAPLPAIRIAADGRGFVTTAGRSFVPFGVNYFRPGTGWAPQVWKQFDAEATRRDFAQMKELGMNCVRVFLSYGSFLTDPSRLDPEGLAKLDQFLTLAEQAGIYVHPTGPDHWEGVPAWAEGDRVADERVLAGLEQFWKLLGERYRGRRVIFAYDLRNEPEVGWDTPALRAKWPAWLAEKYREPAALAAAWKLTNAPAAFTNITIPKREDCPGCPALLDFQRFRESIADEWTRRQVAALKAADSNALVTVGLIQWSVPSLLAAGWQYSGFRPTRQARWLDFMEVHFYPFADGFYQYADANAEARNLAYLDSVVREVARAGKPLVIAEFGWYGGGKLTHGNYAAATEEQQARWCRRLVETTAGLAQGWLNWGLYDHPGANDVTELTGLLTADGKQKAWGREFRELAVRYGGRALPAVPVPTLPSLDWDACVTSAAAGTKFREAYFQAWQKAAPEGIPAK